MVERVKAGVKRTVIATTWVLLAAGAAACDKVPLLAPSGSTINLSASTKVLPVNGSTGLTAFVTESGGTPVQNGTTVRFTTTLGSVQPVETQTVNGIAVALFQAGPSSGVAEIHALSGNAGGSGSTSGTGTGTTSTAQNVVTITIGSAAVNTVTLRANPGSIGPGGGSVELVATVVGESGNGLQSIPVTFNADQGVLSAQTVPTDVNGEARTLLTTGQKTTVTATAGTKTSTAVIVDARTGPGISITCAVAAGGGTGTTCAAVQATPSNTATVQFTVTKGTSTSNFRDTTLDFGDGTSQGLGNLAGGAVVVTHTYNGPSGSSPVGYTAIARATDVNGETASASSTVTVTARAPLGVTITAGAPSTPSGGRTTVAFTANVTPAVGGADVAQSFDWDFGDGTTATTSGKDTSHVYNSGSGREVVKVTVHTTDGRSATGQTEINVP